MENLDSLKQSLRETLEDNKEEILENQYPEDLVREYADGEVPVYTYDLLKIAENDLELAVAEPENMAFDGSNCAVNAIAGVIYEELMSEATEWLDEAREEKENEEDTK